MQGAVHDCHRDRVEPARGAAGGMRAKVGYAMQGLKGCWGCMELGLQARAEGEERGRWYLVAVQRL